MTYPSDFIELLRSQHHPSFEKLYTQTVDQFFRYCQTYYFLSDEQISDIISDFYLKLWTVLPTLKPDYNLHAFLWTMFKNSCKDYFKKKKEVYGSQEQMIERSGDREDENEAEQLSILDQEFQLEQIKQSIAQLDPVSKDIIYFKFIEHKSYDEIAQILSLSQDNIRQKCSRALKQLKLHLATDH